MWRDTSTWEYYGPGPELHSQQFNYLFVDGHAASLTYLDAWGAMPTAGL